MSETYSEHEAQFEGFLPGTDITGYMWDTALPGWADKGTVTLRVAGVNEYGEVMASIRLNSDERVALGKWLLGDE